VDKDEARRLALARIAELRQLGWSELRDRYLQRPETVEVGGPSGTRYQVETQAFWDRGTEGDLRVMVSVDDGGWRAFVPLGESFILARNGSFVGE
jgi:hypothetical protein